MSWFKKLFGGMEAVSVGKKVFISGTPKEVAELKEFVRGVNIVPVGEAEVILLRVEDLDEGYELRYPHAKRFCLVTTISTAAAKRAKASGVIHDFFVMSNTVPRGLKDALK